MDTYLIHASSNLVLHHRDNMDTQVVFLVMRNMKDEDGAYMDELSGECLVHDRRPDPDPNPSPSPGPDSDNDTTQVGIKGGIAGTELPRRLTWDNVYGDAGAGHIQQKTILAARGEMIENPADTCDAHNVSIRKSPGPTRMYSTNHRLARVEAGGLEWCNECQILGGGHWGGFAPGSEGRYMNIYRDHGHNIRWSCSVGGWLRVCVGAAGERCKWDKTKPERPPRPQPVQRPGSSSMGEYKRNVLEWARDEAGRDELEGITPVWCKACKVCYMHAPWTCTHSRGWEAGEMTGRVTHTYRIQVVGERCGKRCAKLPCKLIERKHQAEVRARSPRTAPHWPCMVHPLHPPCTCARKP